MNLSIDMHRAMTDFPYYAESLLKIKDRHGQLVNLRLNTAQKLLHDALETLKLKGRPQHVFVLKARQEGVSTYSEARIFGKSHLQENTKNIIIAHEKESGASIFGMCKLFYECLPSQYRPMTRYSTKQELVFENPDQKTRYTNPGLRSKLQVYTAGKQNVARGTTINNLHGSEIASWTFPEDVIPALMPTIPLDNESVIIFESTAKGVGNYFHHEWTRAKAGESNFYAFFLPWFILPEYAYKFNSKKEQTAFGESLNEEEKELQRTHSLTQEQLYWRRLEIRRLGGDVELFRQEYPATEQEAFIVSGAPVFDRRALRVMLAHCKQPEWRGMIDLNGRLAPDERGELKLWKLPQEKGIYTIGVDVSDGGGRDYSCVEVFAKSKHPFIGEQVAEWHGKIDPYNLARIVEILARLYNDALVAIELNSYGGMTQQALIERYWNLYRQEDLERIDSKIRNKFGWDTTLRTKKLLVAYMTHCVSNKNIFIRSEDLLRECMTFVRDSLLVAGSAAGTGFDDRVMAAMIALFVMHQTFEPYGTADISLTHEAPLRTSTAIDADFTNILEYGRHESYDESWLNY